MSQSNNPQPKEDDNLDSSEKPNHGKLVPFPKAKPNKLAKVQGSFIAFIFMLCLQIKDLLLGDPKDFYGNVNVTPELERHAEITNLSISISNIINIIGIFPFIYLSFAGFGLVLASILSVLMNACLLKFSNIAGTAAANTRPEYKSWAFSGQLGFITLSAFLTLFSGPGAVLFNDYSSIQQLKAQQLINARTQDIKALQHIPSPRLSKLKKKISELTVPKSNPLWERNELLLNGAIEDRKQDWSKLPFNSLPLTMQETILEQQNNSLYETTQAQWQKLLLKRMDSGSDLIFLKLYLPNLYNSHFLSDGTLRSSAESVAIANGLFTKHLVTLNWSEVIFAFFFMGVSVITSGTACYMAITFAQREDVQRSRDSKLKRLQVQAIQLLREKIQGLKKNPQNLDDNNL